jgi:flagellar motor switch protein FliN/FliY
MTWDTLTWTPADASTDGVAAIADLVPMFGSAVDEAVSALVSGPVTTGSPEIVALGSADLPAGFAPVASFELLGTDRRTVWAALVEGSGTTLAGAAVDSIGLGTCLVEALDSALVAIVGEGLGLKDAAADAAFPADLILFRVSLTDAAGAGVQLALAADAATPVAFSTHIVALQALGSDVAHATIPPTGEGTPAPVAPLAAEVPTAVPTPVAPTPATAPAGLPGLPSNVHPLAFQELGGANPSGPHQSIELLLGVNLQVTVEIGRTRLPIRDVLALTPGSIVELDKLAGEKVDVLVNGHQIASGEVVVVDDNFGVRVTDVVSRQRRILSADGAA